MHLHEALFSSDCTTNAIRNIIQKNPDSLNSINEMGFSPLHVALLTKKPISLLQELLNLGADANIFQHDNYSPLFHALLYYENKALFDVIKLLIKFGADVNVKEPCNHTFIHHLLSSVEGSMLIKLLDFLLKNEVDTYHVSRNFTSYLEHACLFIEDLSTRLKVSKMLLEFNVKPNKCKRMQEYNIDFEREIDSVSIQFIKLLMQYVLVNEIKINTFKVEKLHLRKQYDKIINLNEFSRKKCFEELTNYRNCLIKELISMHQDKMTEKLTLFSFISERCSSGLHYKKDEEPVLYKVINSYNSNRYVCCDDLFRASFKRKALMSLISKTCIYGVKSIPNSSYKTKVILSRKAVLEIASYLTRQDVLNLTLAYWIQDKQSDIFSLKSCYRKRTSNSETSLHESFKTLNKRQKLEVLSPIGSIKILNLSVKTLGIDITS